MISLVKIGTIPSTRFASSISKKIIKEHQKGLLVVKDSIHKQNEFNSKDEHHKN